MKAIYFGIILLFLGCQNKENKEEHLKSLINADIAFSARSEKVGNKQAFLEYADSSAVLLRPGSNPVIGLTEIMKLYERVTDTNYLLTWTPSGGDVSVCGDLGYTYGIYRLTSGDEIHEGTYATMWKRNSKGEWKFVMDTGNEGLGK